MLGAALILAAAGMQCAPRDAVMAKLSGQFGEVAQAAGLSEAGIVSVYANPDTGTWTLVLFKADQSACLMASGEAWGGMPETPRGDPL